MIIQGIDSLIADFGSAATRLMPLLVATTKKGALNIKQAAAANAPMRQGHARLYPKSITFDLTTSATHVEAEIGPDKELKQGALGNLIEFGSSKNAAEPSLTPAFEAEELKYVEFCGDAAAQVLR